MILSNKETIFNKTSTKSLNDLPCHEWLTNHAHHFQIFSRQTTNTFYEFHLSHFAQIKILLE